MGEDNTWLLQKLLVSLVHLFVYQTSRVRLRKRQLKLSPTFLFPHKMTVEGGNFQMQTQRAGSSVYLFENPFHFMLPRFHKGTEWACARIEAETIGNGLVGESTPMPENSPKDQKSVEITTTVDELTRTSVRSSLAIAVRTLMPKNSRRSVHAWRAISNDYQGCMDAAASSGIPNIRILHFKRCFQAWILTKSVKWVRHQVLWIPN